MYVVVHVPATWKPLCFKNSWAFSSNGPSLQINIHTEPQDELPPTTMFVLGSMLGSSSFCFCGRQLDLRKPAMNHKTLASGNFETRFSNPPSRTLAWGPGRCGNFEGSGRACGAAEPKSAFCALEAPWLVCQRRRPGGGGGGEAASRVDSLKLWARSLHKPCFPEPPVEEGPTFPFP